VLERWGALNLCSSLAAVTREVQGIGARNRSTPRLWFGRPWLSGLEMTNQRQAFEAQRQAARGSRHARTDALGTD
jgi:hypothetical protein